GCPPNAHSTESFSLLNISPNAPLLVPIWRLVCPFALWVICLKHAERVARGLPGFSIGTTIVADAYNSMQRLGKTGILWINLSVTKNDSTEKIGSSAQSAQFGKFAAALLGGRAAEEASVETLRCVLKNVWCRRKIVCEGGAGIQISIDVHWTP